MQLKMGPWAQARATEDAYSISEGPHRTALTNPWKI